jgi:hypothetical protein
VQLRGAVLEEVKASRALRWLNDVVLAICSGALRATFCHGGIPRQPLADAALLRESGTMNIRRRRR